MATESIQPRVVIGLLAVDEAAGHRMADVVCGANAREFTADGLLIELRLIPYRADQESALSRAIAGCDAVALLVTHIDAVSVETVKAAYRLLPLEGPFPSSILILREPGRMEFKMSCPACGQKLWVRDEDKGRNGRCPHCKKTFVLPAQTALLKSILMTPDSIPLITVTEGHVGKCQGPIAELAGRASRQAQARNSATMRVQIDDGDAPPPPSA